MRAAEREATAAALRYSELRDSACPKLAELDAARQASEAAAARLAEVQRLHGAHAAELRRRVGGLWSQRWDWKRREVTAELQERYSEQRAAAASKIEAALGKVKDALADLVRLRHQSEQAADLAGPICANAREQYLTGIFARDEMEKMAEEGARRIDPRTGRVLQPAAAAEPELAASYLPKVGY